VPTVHAGHYNHFPDQCIGHQEPIIWPPQSPCFMPVSLSLSFVQMAQRESLPITTQNMFATLPVYFLRKNVGFVSSRLL